MTGVCDSMRQEGGRGHNVKYVLSYFWIAPYIQQSSTNADLQSSILRYVPLYHVRHVKLSLFVVENEPIAAT